MLCKLAWRNVRRESRDYAIYFITVALGVAMFYAFNAIQSQTVLFDALSANSIRMLGLLKMLIGLFSGVVACVLGFLVVYANRFLIRRRRREFGTYLLLGMSAGRVSRILLVETLIVGIASLVIGLALGIAASQGLSFATAALMGTTMTKYHFIVSGKAIALTVACFAAIFIVSALIDVIYVRRCKLITLLSAHEANESVRPMNIPLRVVGFIAAVVLIACAYWQLSLNGLAEADAHFWAAVVLVVIGTFLFFWSVAGFAIGVLTRARGVYFKGIRMFTVRQISSKVNTAFASMGIVCIMLFLALSVTSVGMGLVKLFTGDIDLSTRFDATIMSRPWLFTAEDVEVQGDSGLEDYERYEGDMAACLRARSTSWDDVVASFAQFDTYESATTYQGLLDQVPNVEKYKDADTLASIGESNIRVISKSQFNAVCALLGEPSIDLGANEFAIDNVAKGYADLAEAFCTSAVTLDIAGERLHVKDGVRVVPLRTSAIVDVALQIIVPDTVTETLKADRLPDESVLDVAYRADRAQGDALFERVLAEAFPLTEEEYADSEDDERIFESRIWPATSLYTGLGMADQAGGLKMVITFLALYIGFVLLVATAAILAIQQLSETADSLGRYRRLSELGCDASDILGSLRTQTVTYFLAPLILAACHATCAIVVVGGTLFNELGVDITGSISLAAGAVAVLYAVYLIATYVLSKSIVRGTIRQGAFARRS